LSRSRIVRQWLRIAAGLLVFALGVHLTIFANIGLAPWDCLGMGIAKHTPLNYGLAMTFMAVAILGIDLLLKERVGYGTVIDALLTGNFVQMYNDLNPFPLNTNIWTGIALMTGGFVLMALGMWIYMKGEQGCGPRDALLVGLGKRVPKIPIGIVEILLWAAVLLGGWLLGGPVGIGTLICAFLQGPIMQLAFQSVRFDATTIRHQRLSDSFRVFVRGCKAEQQK
jgi:uncharacterized membrane protein YczE